MNAKPMSTLFGHKDVPRNRYRNPWANERVHGKTAQFYENNAEEVLTHRGVSIYKLFDEAYDYVFAGCCITQRAGISTKAIDDILDGKTPTHDLVAEHLAAHGFTPLTYGDYFAAVAAGRTE